MATTDSELTGLNVAISGHRDLSHCNIDQLSEQVHAFFSDLACRFPGLPITLISPLAAGSDTLVARIALALGCRLIVPVPLPLALYEEDYPNQADLAEFRHLCAQAKVFELPISGANTLETIARQGPARDQQYAQLGIFLSSHCQILLALWDGVSGRGLGGTASVVHYHLSGQMPGIHSDGFHRQLLLAEKENDLSYQIPCPRTANEPQLPAIGWHNRNGPLKLQEVEQEYFSAYDHMSEFGADQARYADEIAREGEQLLDDITAQSNSGLDAIATLFRSADWLAIHYHRRVATQLLLTHVMAALMGVSFIVYSEFDGYDYLLPAFLACFAIAWLGTRLANHRQWQRKYLDNRALAEGLRVQLYWTMAGIEDMRGTAFAYDNLMQKQDVELAWIRHVMRNAGVAARTGSAGHRNVASTLGLAKAINEWLGEEQSMQGQLGYFARASRRLQSQLTWTESLGRISLWAGISIAVMMLVLQASLDDQTMAQLLVLMGLLPLVAGIREAYAYKKADKELTKQYQFMKALFTRAGSKLRDTNRPQDQRAILRELGEACLEEHSEWILVHRDRPLENSGLQT